MGALRGEPFESVEDLLFFSILGLVDDRDLFRDVRGTSISLMDR
jgi:hypothetical protein